MWKYYRINRILMDKAGEGDAGGGSLLGGTDTATDSTETEAEAETETAAADTASWADALPEELKGDATLSKYKDVTALAAAHVALQRHLGADKIALPGKNATAEDWQKVYTKLGLPEKIEDYKVTFKEGSTVSEDFAKGFAAKLHESGVLPQQAQALADWVSDLNMEGAKTFMEQRQAKQEADIAGLKKEWGSAFDVKLAGANKLLKEIADDNVAKYLEESGLANDVTLVKLLASAADKVYGEHRTIEGTTERRYTPADARAEANKIIADMNHPYNIADHPNHKAAVKEVAQLFEQVASKA